MERPVGQTHHRMEQTMRSWGLHGGPGRRAGFVRLAWFGVLLLGGWGMARAQAQPEPMGNVWTLQRCIDHAFANNLQLREAALGTAVADIQARGALGAFLPSVNASASHGYNFGQTIDPFTNQFATSRIRSNSMGLSSGLVLFNGFTNHLNLERARLAQSQSQVAIELAQNSVALTVAAAFLNGLFQEEFVGIARANRDASVQQYERIRKLVAAGAAAESDGLNFAAQVAADEANVVAAEQAAGLARLNLAQLLRLDAQTADAMQLARPAERDLLAGDLPPSPAAAVAHALGSFPEVRQAQLAQEDALLVRRLAAAGRSPRAFVSYNMGTGFSGARKRPVGEPTYETIELGDVFINDTLSFALTTQQPVYSGFETVAFGEQFRDNRNQSIFFSLSIPIFNGFSVRNNIEQADVNVLRTSLQWESTRLTLTQTVERAWADAQAAAATLSSRQAALDAATWAEEAARKQFEAGAMGAWQYADARNRLDAARGSWLQARYDAAFKHKILDFYSGKPLTFR